MFSNRYRNNSTQENLDMLDIITMISFLAQIQNMAMDDEQTKYIHGVIEAIENEIDKLHKENDIIMEQNEKIINMLEKIINYGIN